MEESGGAVTLLLQLPCKSADAQSAVKAAAGNKAAMSSQPPFAPVRVSTAESPRRSDASGSVFVFALCSYVNTKRKIVCVLVRIGIRVGVWNLFL